MSEYGDYSDRIFEDNLSPDSKSDDFNSFINFNGSFIFCNTKIKNPQYITLFNESKNHQKQTKDTDLLSNGKTHITIQQNFNMIQVEERSQKAYIQMKKGNGLQTMDLNINFKSIFCRLIKQLLILKMLNNSQRQLFMKYKFESPSFKSLIKFLNNKQNRVIRTKLQQLIKSTQIIKNIFQSSLEFKNKLLMIKFIQTMRKTIFQGNEKQKWKNNF